MTTTQLNALSKTVIGAAIAVHRELGPGLDEVLYEEALHVALAKLSIRSGRQVPLPISYKGCALDCGYRLDLLVEGALVLELKSVAKTLGIHEAQLLTYLKLSGHQLGLLMNFNVLMLKDGIARRVNGFGFEKMTPASSVSDTPAPGMDLSGRIIRCAMEVHRTLGPGLLRSSYSECLVWELSDDGIPFVRDIQKPMCFEDVTLSQPVKLELVVGGVAEKALPVGVVSVNEVTPLLEAQFRSRLRSSGYTEGLLVNFNSATLRDGLRRVGAGTRGKG